MSDMTTLMTAVDSLLRISPRDMIEETIRTKPYLFNDQTQYRRTLKLAIGRLYQEQIQRLRSHENEHLPSITQAEREECTRLQGELRNRWVAVMGIIDNPEHSGMIVELIQRAKSTKPHG